MSNKAQSKIRLFSIQKIDNAHSDSIWVAKFSHCGRYLATGGKDCCLKVWRVRNPIERTVIIEEEKGGGEGGETEQDPQNNTLDLTLFDP